MTLYWAGGAEVIHVGFKQVKFSVAGDESSVAVMFDVEGVHRPIAAASAVVFGPHLMVLASSRSIRVHQQPCQERWN